jgi:hypothetical protein
MNKTDIFFGIFFIAIILFCYLQIHYFIKKEIQCIKGKKHNWVFINHSKGNTGDLGFGIKGFWNTNHYRCSICNKEKSQEL